MGDENTGLIGSYVGKKYSGSAGIPVGTEEDAAATAGKGASVQAPLTQEQADVIGKAKKEDADNIRNDPNARLQAQVLSGDTDPSVVANMNSKSEIAANKLQSARDIAEIKTNSAYEVQMAKLDAALAKAGSKAEKSEKVMTFIDGQRKEITSEAATLKGAMTAELNALGKFAEPEEIKKVKDAYAPKFQALENQRAQLNKDFAEIRSRFGLSPVAEPAAKPEAAPSAPSGGITKEEYAKLPKGARFTAPDGTVRIKP